MKIALVVPGGVDRSGDRKVIPALLALIRRLARDHEVHVFALRQEPLPGSWKLEGAQIYNAGKKMAAWRTFSAIRHQHRVKPFDVLHCIWSGKIGLLGVSCAGLLGIPSLVHVAGGELTCVDDISYGGSCGRGRRLFQAIVLRATATVTAASAPMIESLSSIGIAGVRVPLGVDLDIWPPRAPERRNPGDPVRLIHVGSLNRVKDQTTLLRAVALVAESGQAFHLDVVGFDTLDGAIQSLSAQLGLAHQVTFHGALRQSELRPLMTAAHLLLMSSRHEAGPLVVLEAGVSGVPTVGTHVGHIAEWAQEASLSVPVADPPALAQAIIDLCHDEERRLALAQEARARAVREDADYCARRFSELYTSLCRRN